MKKQNANLTKILTRKHEKQWVALSADKTKVLGFSEKLGDLYKKLEGKTGVTYIKVLASDTEYAFGR